MKFKRPKPSHGDLTKWAKQGVLLINAVLTVRAAKSNSHKGKGWEKFTDAVIQAINTKKSGVVFLLWGRFAQTKAKFINTNVHKVLMYSHPSPLSAAAGGDDFSQCKHFSETNDYLRSENKPEIDWNLD